MTPRRRRTSPRVSPRSSPSSRPAQPLPVALTAHRADRQPLVVLPAQQPPRAHVHPAEAQPGALPEVALLVPDAVGTLHRRPAPRGALLLAQFFEPAELLAQAAIGALPDGCGAVAGGHGTASAFAARRFAFCLW